MNVPSFDSPLLSSLDDMAISNATSPQGPAALAYPAKDIFAKMSTASSMCVASDCRSRTPPKQTRAYYVADASKLRYVSTLFC